MRECGTCKVCCTLTYVSELNKPEGMVCVHCDNGCRIYEGRPDACASYQCAWLKGDLPEAMRPDMACVMIEEYPLMVAALIAPDARLSHLAPHVMAELDRYVAAGKPVIATGQFAKLPDGMGGQEAKDILVRTVKEYRNGR